MTRTLPLLAIVAVLAASRPASAGPPTDEVDKLVAEQRDLMAKQRWIPAIKVARKVVALQVKRHGEKHPATITAMRDLGVLHQASGDFVSAQAVNRKVLALVEKTKGKDDMETAQAVLALASGHWARMEWDAAEPLYRRALAIHDKRVPDTDQWAGMQVQMAGFMTSRQSYAEAEQFYARAQAYHDKKHGAESAEMMGVLTSWVWLHITSGDRKRAGDMLDRIEKLATKHQGTMPMAIAGQLDYVSSLQRQIGNTRKADQLADRVEKIYQDELDKAEKQHGANHDLARWPLQSLAALWQRRGDYERARTAFRRLLVMDEKAHGAGTVATVLSLYPLADIESKLGNHRGAIETLIKVKKIYDKQYTGWYACGPGSVLSEEYRLIGEWDPAIALVRECLQGAIQTFGARHPIVAMQRERLAILLLGARKARSALRELEQALPVEQAYAAVMLGAGTEADNRRYLNDRAFLLHLAVSLNGDHLPRDRTATRLGFTTLLGHKGRLLDASANTVGALRRRLSDADKQLLDELASARAQLAKLIIAGPQATGEAEYDLELARLENDVRGLEVKARRRSAPLRAAERPIDVAAIQRALPKDGVLVDIVAYRRFDPGAKLGADAVRRYGAYVLARTGEPSWVDLGDGAAIDELAATLRKQLGAPDGDYAASSKKLYATTIGKLGAAARARHMLIAPDGALNLVPFGALLNPDGKHLIERSAITYLSSGRDLLRFDVVVKGKSKPVIVADPRFDGDGDRANDGRKVASRGRRSANLRGMKWGRLPGTAQEAAEVARQLPSPLVLSGARATETAVKDLRGPRILHMATHGFFLPAVEEPAAATTPSSTTSTPAAAAGAGVWVPPAVDPENPLLRSGLVFSGANQLTSGNDDGVLTGLEAAGLDLWGTELVVLSACETGVGKVAEGDGVYGLRRALVIAGAESLVMSLWEVDDSATRDLMIGYYKRLAGGKGRSDALREIQLSMLSGGDHAHPYYWAAFIPAGQWAPLRK